MKAMLYMLKKLQALQTEMIQKNKMFWLDVHDNNYMYVVIRYFNEEEGDNTSFKTFNFYKFDSANKKMNTYNELVEFINTHDTN